MTQSPKSLGTTASAPPKPNQVEEQLNILNDALAKLDTRLRSLSGCLEPVLRSEDMEKCGKDEPAAMLVPRAEAVRSARWKVVAMTEHVEDLLDRLEA